ncbi:MAG: FHA domain-containing protein [Myxococcota bacterium]|nr:FHA domain-containing protein [Myxococcota bacterium]
MKARLFCKVGDLSGASTEFEAEARIGRGSSNELSLATPLASRDHARIHWSDEAGCYLLEDLKSANGTSLDGLRVEQPEKLGRLHVITFADTHDFIFQVLDGDAPAPAPADPEARARLTVGGKRYNLRPGSYMIGRVAEAQIQIESNQVSRQHARLDVSETGVTLTDLGSSNGTFVDDAQLAANVAAPVSSASQIRFGSVRATLEGV